ncbi:hypothetical protein O3P69_003208 [Scylla paramamosain]|uniref:Uncharacterized protein n=1 Tax=Scylla paramamosain TaxID=85552 RepID=A0AAW0UJU6_SCYPA
MLRVCGIPGLCSRSVPVRAECSTARQRQLVAVGCGAQGCRDALTIVDNRVMLNWETVAVVIVAVVLPHCHYSTGCTCGECHVEVGGGFAFPSLKKDLVQYHKIEDAADHLTFRKGSTLKVSTRVMKVVDCHCSSRNS